MGSRHHFHSTPTPGQKPSGPISHECRILFARNMLSGTPGGIRTHDPQIRNLMLYPTELRGHLFNLFFCSP
jgi:hypothetical protein